MTDITDKLHRATLGTDGQPLPDTANVTIDVGTLRRAIRRIHEAQAHKIRCR